MTADPCLNPQPMTYRKEMKYLQADLEVYALDAIHAKIMRFVTIVTFGHAGADNATARVKYIKGQLTHASIPNLCHIQNK